MQRHTRQHQAQDLQKQVLLWCGHGAICRASAILWSQKPGVVKGKPTSTTKSSWAPQPRSSKESTDFFNNNNKNKIKNKTAQICLTSNSQIYSGLHLWIPPLSHWSRPYYTGSILIQSFLTAFLCSNFPCHPEEFIHVNSRPRFWPETCLVCYLG